jgi:WD40 repeat protein
LARIGTIRLRHGTNADGVVCFAADGSVLISSVPGIVHFWDVATGREIRRLTTLNRGPESGSFSSDGWSLALPISAPEVTVGVWDLRTGRERAHCRLPVRDSVWSVALAPDGKAVAAGTNAGRVIVWGLPSGERLWEQKGDSPVQSVLCTPAGAVVTMTQAGQVGVWEGATGKQLRLLPGSHRADRGCLAVSPDGRVLAVCEPKAIALYDAASWAELRRLPGPFPNGTPMRFSGDGRCLLTTGSPGFLLWDVATGKVVHTLSYPYWITSVDLSPDGKLVALAVQSAVRLYDVATGQQLHRRDAPEGEIPFLAFTPDGSTIATIGRMAEGNFGLWDPATGRRLQVWKPASPGVPFRFAPGGTAVFVPEYANVIRLRGLCAGAELRRFVLAGQGPRDYY